MQLCASRFDMRLTDRFALTWTKWDERVHSPREATSFLTSAKDEELLELLAGESEKDRKYERDIVATEVINRLSRRSMELPGGATTVYRAARAAHEAAVQSQIAIHTAGGVLKAYGDDELGGAISAAAIVSLDTTKLAVDAARGHLSEVQAALAQSRVAERLIQDAAHAAIEAAVRAEQGARRVAELGKEAEAKAALDAAKLLRAAADEAVDMLGERQNASQSRRQ